MTLYANGKLTPVGQAIIESLWVVFSGAVLATLTELVTYLSTHQAVNVPSMLTMAAIVFGIAFIHGIIAIGRNSKNLAVQAIAAEADQVVTQVEQKIFNDGGKGTTFPQVAALQQPVRTNTPPVDNRVASQMAAQYQQMYQSQPDVTQMKTTQIPAYQPQAAPTLYAMAPTQANPVVNPVTYQQFQQPYPQASQDK